MRCYGLTCCLEDLIEPARALAGQLTYEDVAANELVCIRVERFHFSCGFLSMDWTSTEFIARNQLTETSALGLLHLLNHLTVPMVVLDRVCDYMPDGWRLNPRLFESLPAANGEEWPAVIRQFLAAGAS